MRCNYIAHAGNFLGPITCIYDEEVIAAAIVVQRMKLVLLGKGGSGKSALVNHLLQFSPGDLRAAKESGAGVGVSSGPRLYENYRDGVLVEVWDTPGLDNESNAQQILKKLSESTKERADVVLFCVALSRAMRIDDSYRKLISLLTKTYKPDLWKQTIFVLTFVNETAYKADHQTEKHMGIFQNVKRELQQTLVQAGVSGAIANSVPLLTAGYDSEILPHETEDWNERLFRECSKKANSNFVAPLVPKIETSMLKRMFNTLWSLVSFINLRGVVGVAAVSAIGVMIGVLYSRLLELD